MPLYEYRCNACGDQFELIRRFSDPPLEACPACGGSVRKLLSSPAIQFKGSGWYVTDYAKKDKPASETDKGADKTSSASADGKKDSAAGKTTSASSTKDTPASTSSTSASTSSTSK